MEGVGGHEHSPQAALPDGPLPPPALPQRLVAQHPVGGDDEPCTDLHRRQARGEDRRHPHAMEMDHERTPLRPGRGGGLADDRPDPPGGLPLAAGMPRRRDRIDGHAAALLGAPDHRRDRTGVLAGDSDRHTDRHQRLGQLADTDRDTPVIVERARHEEHARAVIGRSSLRRNHASVLLTMGAARTGSPRRRRGLEASAVVHVAGRRTARSIRWPVGRG